MATAKTTIPPRNHDTALLVGTARPPRIPVIALGMSLGIFLTITYSLCVGFDLLFPAHAMYGIWGRLLPGFVWLSWPSFGLGFAESFAYGWYAAVIFAPLYNLFARWGWR